MRSELLNPPLDAVLLRETIDLAKSACEKFENAQDVSTNIERFAELANLPIERASYFFKFAFGSESPEIFARKILTNWDALPKDLSDAEMLNSLSEFASHKKVKSS